MPALSDHILLSRLSAALPAGTVVESSQGMIHPVLLRVPGFGRVRVYLWTITPDRSAASARPPGEYKIQLIVDGQPRGRRGSIDLSGAYTALLGYSPEFGVFAAWEANRYSDFAYSANAQVREGLLLEARTNGWAVAAPRRIRSGQEVRVAFTPGNLSTFLRTSREADSRGLEGLRREAFFLARTPNARIPDPPARERELVTYIARERDRIAANRLRRDSRFAPAVKEQYDHSCAICSTQLEIVEAAHIIPAHEPDGRDEPWNGVALCPNHHSLFDARHFIVDPDLQVHVDRVTVQYLRDSDRAAGIDLLLQFDGCEMRPPRFWSVNIEMRSRMLVALSRRAALSA